MKDKKGKSFVAIMVTIALLALFLRVVSERIIKITNSQNESNARTTLKLISIALENYARDNHGIYPSSISILSQAKPDFLDRDYVGQSPIKGYSYSCPRLNESGYNCYARPLRCNLTGKITYSVTTGSLLVSEECDRKE
ncbi:MAG: hypothetical protein WCK61_03820 [Candidatus Omnitrophota bacterium]